MYERSGVVTEEPSDDRWQEPARRPGLLLPRGRLKHGRLVAAARARPANHTQECLPYVRVTSYAF